MDVLDKFFIKYAYKFPKGYPDMNDPKDKEMLFELAYRLIDEDEEVEIKIDDKTTTTKSQDPTGGSQTYNDTIRYALSGGSDWENHPIPKPKNKYPYKGNTFSISVKGDDKEIFNKLYPVKPPKAGKEIGSAGSLGVGNGEIALYWLYHFSDSADVTEGRSGDDPDLFFNNQGVEVKSWTKDSGLHGLGRFGADKENLSILSIVFGFNALLNVLGDDKTPSKTINPTNFTGPQLTEAMGKVKEFKALLNKNSNLQQDYTLFKNIQDNIDKIYSQLNISDGDSGEEMAAKMAIRLLEPKLNRKPGDGNHLANVKDNGDVKFFQIDFEKLKNSKDLLNDFQVKQSAISINFDKIWG